MYFNEEIMNIPCVWKVITVLIQISEMFRQDFYKSKFLSRILYSCLLPCILAEFRGTFSYVIMPATQLNFIVLTCQGKKDYGWVRCK